MDSSKQKMNDKYAIFLGKMHELYIRKKALISNFRAKLENRKIDRLKEELKK